MKSSLTPTMVMTRRSPAWQWIGSILVAVLLATWPTAARPHAGPASPKTQKTCIKKWGIEIVSLRLTAADGMIDFRYKIVDPEKAAFLVDRTIDAYLVDQGSGRTGGVPSSAKIGPMRQTTKFGMPPEGRTFFMLFGNPGKAVQRGGKVTVVIGDFKVKNLVVE